jgi:SAM-dependent methyltransferase
MGRFETAAEFYRFREPYPEGFFETVSQRLGITQRTRMLDVGCGPGNLAIGFAPFVASCTAIDIEPEMLRVARLAAIDAGANVQFFQTSIEQFGAAEDSFDFVTIGRALHWLSRETTLAVLERVVVVGGHLAICGSAATDAPVNAWTAKFREIRRRWSSDPDESRYRPDLDAWFASSSFQRVDEITVQQRCRFTIDELIGRGLSFSITSPAVLGPRRAEFEAEIRAVLEPFAVDGVVEEEVMAKAMVFAFKTHDE